MATRMGRHGVHTDVASLAGPKRRASASWRLRWYIACYRQIVAAVTATRFLSHIRGQGQVENRPAVIVSGRREARVVGKIQGMSAEDRSCSILLSMRLWERSVSAA